MPFFLGSMTCFFKKSTSSDIYNDSGNGNDNDETVSWCHVRFWYLHYDYKPSHLLDIAHRSCREFYKHIMWWNGESAFEGEWWTYWIGLILSRIKGLLLWCLLSRAWITSALYLHHNSNRVTKPSSRQLLNLFRLRCRKETSSPLQNID